MCECKKQYANHKSKVGWNLYCNNSAAPNRDSDPSLCMSFLTRIFEGATNVMILNYQEESKLCNAGYIN